MSLSIPNRPVGTDVRSVSQLLANFDAIINWVNGANVAAANLTSALASSLGVNAGGVVRRGKTNIATEETISATSYGFATTPDRVSSVVLPTDGLIFVAFQGVWKQTGANGLKAAIFVGANQLKIGNNTGGAPVVQEATCAASALNPNYTQLFTNKLGLQSGGAPSTDATDVTTGQLVGSNGNDGGIVGIFAAAGTYDVGIKYLVSASTATVKNRKLWVWTADYS